MYDLVRHADRAQLGTFSDIADGIGALGRTFVAAKYQGRFELHDRLGNTVAVIEPGETCAEWVY